MAKSVPFKAYDLQRRSVHTIPAPLVKINQHRVDKREWAESAKKGRKGTRRVSKRSAAKKARQEIAAYTAASILRDESGICLHCKNWSDEAECDGAKCYRDFTKANILTDPVDIKGPGQFGYGAYTKPGVTIKKDQWVGEYIGELHPMEWELGTDQQSLYKYTILDKCHLDAEKAGNWTRFINSNCRPNLRCSAEVVGRRSVVLFQALRDIGPGEELTFNYGKYYFRDAGFACKCSSCEGSEQRKKVRGIIAAL